MVEVISADQRIDTVAMAANLGAEAKVSTKLLPIDITRIARTGPSSNNINKSGGLALDQNPGSKDVQSLRHAASLIRTSNIPVAFPTETVYGLGADATRSSAVRGIFRTKGRPADNPLIVHVSTLEQLRGLLRRRSPSGAATALANGHLDPSEGFEGDPIPEIYHSLIERFWPGPLTILLPRDADCPLAPEVTAGLHTFGARMPRSPIALALIDLADVPIAAPSANLSGRPSPTTAGHVLDDLDGRIDVILDGGPCKVGLESTVVNGLSAPPRILRPGGISLDQLRRCPGWEHVVPAYKDTSDATIKPEAPGMKYKHYSPKAQVLLYESSSRQPNSADIVAVIGAKASIGILRTKVWAPITSLLVGGNLPASLSSTVKVEAASDPNMSKEGNDTPFTTEAAQLAEAPTVLSHPAPVKCSVMLSQGQATIWEIAIGPNVDDIARGLFSGLRTLDRLGVDAILVEGIDEHGDAAAAIMNRLRKAAEYKIQS